MRARSELAMIPAMRSPPAVQFSMRVGAVLALLSFACVGARAEEQGVAAHFPGRVVAERLPPPISIKGDAYSYISMYPAPMMRRPAYLLAVLSIGEMHLAVKGGTQIRMWQDDGTLTAEAAISLTEKRASSIALVAHALHESEVWRRSAETWWKQHIDWPFSPEWIRLGTKPWRCQIYAPNDRGDLMELGQAEMRHGDGGEYSAALALDEDGRTALLRAKRARNVVVVVSFRFRAQFAEEAMKAPPLQGFQASTEAVLPPLDWSESLDWWPTHMVLRGPKRSDAMSDVSEWVGRMSAADHGHPLTAPEAYGPEAMWSFIEPYVENAIDDVATESIGQTVGILVDPQVAVWVNRKIFRTQYKTTKALAARLAELLRRADRGIAGAPGGSPEPSDAAKAMSLRVAFGVRIPSPQVEQRSLVLAARLLEVLAGLDRPSARWPGLNLQKLEEVPARLAQEGLPSKDALKFWATAHAAFRGNGAAFNQASPNGGFIVPVNADPK